MSKPLSAAESRRLRHLDEATRLCVSWWNADAKTWCDELSEHGVRVLTELLEAIEQRRRGSPGQPAVRDAQASPSEVRAKSPGTT